MHPELFELKALVAGRLDTHRRREIDDHLGSCAECSRHYVALMLGSSSPKTAEAEARQALVPTGAGTVLTLVGGGSAPAPMYGIDAPIAPSAPPRATPRPPHNNLVALETEFPPAQSRTQVPVSASLVDAISRLRAESEAPRAAAAAPAAEPVAAPAPVLELVRTPEPVAAPAPVPTPAPAAVKAPEIIAPPVPESPLIAPSIFTPTPYDGVSVIHPPAPHAQARTQSATELVVTFSSTPKRNAAQRSNSTGTFSPVTSPVVTPSQEYVSQAIPTLAHVPASEFELSAPAAPPRPATTGMPRGAMAAAAAVAALVVGIAGFRYFQSSVSEAASAAAAAAAKKVEAAAAVRAPVTPPVTSAPAQVQTRIVYVEKPASRKAQPAQTKPETVLVAPAVPIAVTLPEVNLNTGTEGAAQSNTQRGATTELTRSARATASRTAAPRP